MALGKNFRLPTDVRPVRYNAHLAPDLEKRSFEGRCELEVSLAAARRQITLHAIEVSLFFTLPAGSISKMCAT